MLAYDSLNLPRDHYWCPARAKMEESGVSWRGLARVARRSTGKMPRCRILDCVPGGTDNIAFLLGSAHHQTETAGRGPAR